MRMSVLSLSLIALAPLCYAGTASAQSPYSYPWCAREFKQDGGVTSCYFTSYQQCMTTISGVGGYCYQSPYYHAAPAKAPVRPRRHGRVAN